MTSSSDPAYRRAPLPAALGVPLSLIYSLAIRRINRRFDRKKGVVRFDRPVISVGNLSVGGTGKTPMVARIVSLLRDAGHRPCIAMRGYGSGTKQESDEAAAYRRAFPDVPIVARANRTLGLIQLFGEEYDRDGTHSDCIVLDDGFQHRQIARDLDIVLIDASRPPTRDRLLPAGWLREPMTSLARASAVIITHAEAVPGADISTLEAAVAGIHGRGVIAVCRHAWADLAVREDTHDHTQPVGWLVGKRVVGVCAIGNPAPFLAAASKAVGGPLSAQVVLNDHDPYASGTVHKILDVAQSVRAQAIITTDKDWSKLASITDWPCPVARARLELQFDRGSEALESCVLETLARGVPED